MTLENLWARTNESTKLFDFRDEDAGKYRFFPKGAPRPKSVGAKPGKTAVPKLEGICCGNGEDPKTNGIVQDVVRVVGVHGASEEDVRGVRRVPPKRLVVIDAIGRRPPKDLISPRRQADRVGGQGRPGDGIGRNGVQRADAPRPGGKRSSLRPGGLFLLDNQNRISSGQNASRQRAADGKISGVDDGGRRGAGDIEATRCQG